MNRKEVVMKEVLVHVLRKVQLVQRIVLTNEILLAVHADFPLQALLLVLLAKVLEALKSHYAVH